MRPPARPPAPCQIVDRQSWPLESVAVPGLWNRSWSPRERYTLADVGAVVEYARARGVRTVPEFDTPGHANSMCYQYPDLCPSATCNYAGTSVPLTPVPDAQGKPVALNAIQAVLTEIAAQTPDEFFHLGGDEVNQACVSGGGGGSCIGRQHLCAHARGHALQRARALVQARRQRARGRGALCRALWEGRAARQRAPRAL
jgi:N-acetyl-beta-hexosaminidase